ncbi:uncharacterized protein LOC122811436 [Protopterus annectens]|uniref:uncharacterized protein LOC122811436 n=1 Tax=Protopterus annectens TaxID=7888 RepID=UPI001CFBC116|nr:uncharacterized protein LOC122811436 [Protopterus annectens]
MVWDEAVTLGDLGHVSMNTTGSEPFNGIAQEFTRDDGSESLNMVQNTACMVQAVTLGDPNFESHNGDLLETFSDMPQSTGLEPFKEAQESKAEVATDVVHEAVASGCPAHECLNTLSESYIEMMQRTVDSRASNEMSQNSDFLSKQAVLLEDSNYESLNTGLVSNEFQESTKKASSEPLDVVQDISTEMVQEEIVSTRNHIGCESGIQHLYRYETSKVEQESPRVGYESNGQGICGTESANVPEFMPPDNCENGLDLCASEDPIHASDIQYVHEVESETIQQSMEADANCECRNFDVLKPCEGKPESTQMGARCEATNLQGTDYSLVKETADMDSCYESNLDIRLSKAAEAGQEEPTLAEAGQEEPTLAEAGQEEPTLAEAGQEEPTLAEAGQEEPTLAEAGQEEPTLAEAGQEEPTLAEAGQEEPTLAEAGQEEPTLAEAGQEEPTLAEAGQEEPTLAEAGQEEPTLAEAGQEEPTLAEAGQEEPTLAEAGQEEPTLVEAGQEEPTSPSSEGVKASTEMDASYERKEPIQPEPICENVSQDFHATDVCYPSDIQGSFVSRLSELKQYSEQIAESCETTYLIIHRAELTEMMQNFPQAASTERDQQQIPALNSSEMQEVLPDGPRIQDGYRTESSSERVQENSCFTETNEREQEYSQPVVCEGDKDICLSKSSMVQEIMPADAGGISMDIKGTDVSHAIVGATESNANCEIENKNTGSELSDVVKYMHVAGAEIDQGISQRVQELTQIGASCDKSVTSKTTIDPCTASESDTLDVHLSGMSEKESITTNRCGTASLCVLGPESSELVLEGSMQDTLENEGSSASPRHETQAVSEVAVCEKDGKEIHQAKSVEKTVEQDTSSVDGNHENGELDHDEGIAEKENASDHSEIQDSEFYDVEEFQSNRTTNRYTLESDISDEEVSTRKERHWRLGDDNLDDTLEYISSDDDSLSSTEESITLGHT